jgi:hypothetical protein
VKKAAEVLVKKLRQREQAGDRWREQDFVFTSDLGDHRHLDTATSVFAKARQAFTPALLSKGVITKLVQQQLGPPGAGPGSTTSCRARAASSRRRWRLFPKEGAQRREGRCHGRH